MANKKETKTHFNYNRLWKLLIDRGIQKQELQKMSDVSAASIAKMGRGENVFTPSMLPSHTAMPCATIWPSSVFASMV